MAWVAAVGAAASALGGMDANRRASEAQQAQTELQQAELGWRQKIYDEEKALYAPIKGQLVDLASGNDPLYWGDTKDQIEKNFSQGFVQAGENAARTGTMDSGLKQAWDTSALLRKASDMSKAWLQGKKDKTSLALSLLGRDQTNALGSRMGDSLGYGARMYGDISNQWAGNARNAWAGAASGAASAAELYSKNKGWT